MLIGYVLPAVIAISRLLRIESLVDWYVDRNRQKQEHQEQAQLQQLPHQVQNADLVQPPIQESVSSEVQSQSQPAKAA